MKKLLGYYSTLLLLMYFSSLQAQDTYLLDSLYNLDFDTEEVIGKGYYIYDDEGRIVERFGSGGYRYIFKYFVNNEEIWETYKNDTLTSVLEIKNNAEGLTLSSQNFVKEDEILIVQQVDSFAYDSANNRLFHIGYRRNSADELKLYLIQHWSFDSNNNLLLQVDSSFQDGQINRIKTEENVYENNRLVKKTLFPWYQEQIFTRRYWYKDEVVDSVHTLIDDNGAWIDETEFLYEYDVDHTTLITNRKAEESGDFESWGRQEFFLNTANDYIEHDSIVRYRYSADTLEWKYKELNYASYPTENTMLIEFQLLSYNSFLDSRTQWSFYSKADPIISIDSLNEFQVYPNPASSGGEFVIESDNSFSEVSIYNEIGGLIKNQLLSEETTVLFAPEVPGKYFIQLWDPVENKSTTKLFIVY